MTMFEADYTVATQDDAGTFTSGYAEIAHPCPLIAAMVAKAEAEKNYDQKVEADETGVKGSGVLILADGFLNKHVDGEQDHATYWSFDAFGNVKTNTRSPELVASIKAKESLKVTSE